MDTKAQKEWFEKLDDVVSPIYTARNHNFHPGKQYELGRLKPPIHHRTIGSNEIVLDFDAPSFRTNSILCDKVLKYLLDEGVPYLLFWSGGKGLHVHIFLDVDINTQEGIELVRKAVAKGFNIFRELRLRLARGWLIGAGLREEEIRYIDLQKLAWNDIGGKKTLIRCCGGSNKKPDKHDSSILVGGFKTHIHVVPMQKPRDNQWEDVEYPTDIPLYKVPESIVLGLCHDFMKAPDVKTKIPITYKGKYLSLPAVQTILDGLETGSRSLGAKIISIAARLDGLKAEETIEILKKYVQNCRQVPEPFEIDEAKKWMDWVYKHPAPFWSCGNLVSLGVHDAIICPICSEEKKKKTEIFNKGDPLDVIKKALDKTIEGEDNLKLELFLHYLAGKINPKYLIMIDGEASSGKSFIMKEVANIFGEEEDDWFLLSRITKSALNHLVETDMQSWEGKIVIIEELQGASDALEQFRVLISEGKLSLLLPEEVKRPDGTTTHESKKKVVHANCMFVTCNAEAYDKGAQMASRAILLNCDESSEQTQKIQDYWLDDFGHKIDRSIDNLNEIREGIKNLIKPDDIAFPHSDSLKGWLPKDNVRGRRDINKFITGIKSLAFLYQRHRRWFKNKAGKNILVAQLEDVKRCLQIMGKSLGASMQGLTQKEKNDFEIIYKSACALNPGGNPLPFTTHDMERWLRCSQSNVYRKLTKYQELGLIAKKVGNGDNYYEVVKNSSDDFDVKFCIQRIDEFIDDQHTMIDEWAKERNYVETKK